MQGAKHRLNKNPVSSGKTHPTPSNNHISFTNLAPQSPSEHYWASRAQKAEALLSAREKHFEEIGKVREEEALKRTRELQVLQNRYRQQYRNLERLVFVLVATVVSLAALLIYFATTSKSAGQTTGSGNAFTSIFRFLGRPTNRGGLKDHASSRLNFHFHLPSHFTIPILSPWTSVVEHQTSHHSHASSSASFYLVVFLLLVIITFIIIAWSNSHISSGKASQGLGPPPRFATGIQQLCTFFLGLRGISFFHFRRWAWNWAYKVLLLLGIVSS